MEHNPYILLEDGTEITYSDIKEKEGKSICNYLF